MIEVQFSNLNREQKEYLLSKNFQDAMSTTNALTKIEDGAITNKSGNIIVDLVIQLLMQKAILDTVSLIEDMIEKNKDKLNKYVLNFKKSKIEIENGIEVPARIHVSHDQTKEKDALNSKIIHETQFQSVNLFHLKQRLHLLLLGVNSYSDETIEDLKTAHRDVAIFEDFCGAYSDSTPYKRLDATRSEVFKTIDLILNSIQFDDSLLFHFSGHATLNESKDDLILWAKDTFAHNIHQTGISFLQILQKLSSGNEKSKFKNILFVLDCCYSGNIVEILDSKKTEVDNVFINKKYGGFYFILSAPPDAVSIESRRRSVTETSAAISRILQKWKDLKLSLDGRGHLKDLSFSALCRAFSNEVRGDRSRGGQVIVADDVHNDLFGTSSDFNFHFVNIDNRFDTMRSEIKEFIVNGNILPFLDRQIQKEINNTFATLNDMESYTKSKGILRKKYNLLIELVQKNITIDIFIRNWNTVLKSNEIDAEMNQNKKPESTRYLRDTVIIAVCLFAAGLILYLDRTFFNSEEKAEINRLKENITNLTDNLAIANKNITFVTHNNAELKAELRVVNEKYKDLSAQHMMLQNQYSNVELSKNDYYNQKIKIETESKNEIERLIKEKNDLNVYALGLAAEEEGLRKKLDSMSVQYASLESRKDSLLGDKNRLELEVKKLSGDLEDKLNVTKQLSRDLDREKKNQIQSLRRIRELEDIQQKNSSIITDLNRQIEYVSFGPGDLPGEINMQFGHRIQKLLWEAGCYFGYIDGDIGSETLGAARDFFQSNKSLGQKVVDAFERTSSQIGSISSDEFAAFNKKQLEILQAEYNRGARCNPKIFSVNLNDVDQRGDGFTRLRGRFSPSADYMFVELPLFGGEKRNFILIDAIGTLAEFSVHNVIADNKPPTKKVNLIGRSARGRGEFETLGNERTYLKLKKREEQTIWYSVILLNKP
ncbi:MAG: hypothetical protein GC188_11655 [Alphaproteobacteria bacterium]|nr:hypothetical protein [Alphaproteobacteria bacterium]